MANRLESFFEQAMGRIPRVSEFLDGDIRPPDYPEHGEEFPDLDDTERLVEIARIESSDLWREYAGDISDDDRRLLIGGIQEAGLHVCAFYKSRRHRDVLPFPGRWGIFYIRHAICWISELIEDYYPGRGPQREQAHKFLREHERYHLRFDLHALSVEANLQRPCYEPLKRAFRRHRIYHVEEALGLPPICWTLS